MSSPKPAAFADRRQRILDAAVGLFAATPYGDVHMDAIAAAARVAKPTLYRYFPTKEALFIEGLEWALAELRRTISALRSQPRGEARLRRAVALVLERIGPLSPAIRAFEGQSSELGERSRRVIRQGFGALRATLAELLDDDIESGAYAPVDTALAVLVILGGVRMAAAHAAVSAGAEKPLADALADILLNGLRARDAEASREAEASTDRLGSLEPRLGAVA
jgi:TetR/AcrR family transcriptional repressor of mexJK operon